MARCSLPVSGEKPCTVLVLDKNDPRKVITFEKYFAGQFGRMRDVVQGPDGALYILTNNRDGRGNPRQGDDRILRLTRK